MRSVWFLLLGLMCGLGVMFVSTGWAQPAQTNGKEIPDVDEFSYGVGFFLGGEVREGIAADGIDAKMDLVGQGFIDGLNANEPKMDPKRLEEVLQAVHQIMQERTVDRLLQEDPNFKALYDRNQARSEAYMEMHGKEPGVTTLPNGIQYKVLQTGTGPSPKLDDSVIVNFRGTLVDGREVNSGEGVEFKVNDIIEGGTIILQMMKVGDRWQVAVPPALAFGRGGKPPVVGPNETVLIDVELLEVKR